MEDSLPNSNFLLVANKIILFAKKKRGLILAGVFSIFFVIVFSFYFWHSWQTADSLVSLAPIDSVLYFHVRDSAWPKKPQTISDLPLKNFYQQLANKGIIEKDNLEKDLLPKVKEFSFVLLSRDNFESDLVLILKFKNKNVSESIIGKIKNHLLIDNNILVVANSQSALDRISEVKNGKTHSLSLELNQKKLAQSQVVLFISSANLKYHLSQSQKMVDKILVQLLNQDIYLGLNYKNNQWQFKIADNFYLNKMIVPPLIDSLPKDFDSYISNINLFEIFNGLGQSDQNISDSFSQLTESLKTVYGFFAEKIINLINQPTDLIIYKTEKPNALGFDFLLVFNKSNQNQIDSLQELVKIILAQKLPNSKNHILPDGTAVTELVADTELWQWQKENLAGQNEISYLAEPKLNLEIAYTVFNNQLLVSNSIQRLKNFILETKVPLTSLTKECHHTGLINRYLILKSQLDFIPFAGYMPSGEVLLIEGSEGISGCILGD